MKSKDLISKAKTLNAIKNELAYQEKHATPGEDIDTGIICGLGQAVEIVKGIEPSAEKKGKWIYYLDNGQTRCKCSNCLTSYGCLDTPYCPNCGARMEG